ncbi:MAG: hypothetical protein AB7G47_22945 [Mycolicibacterium sp.]
MNLVVYRVDNYKPAHADFEALDRADQSGLVCAPSSRIPAPLSIAMMVCQEHLQGASADGIVYCPRGDGVPHLTTANMMVIYAAATTYLC